ncbi:uncharacterized protein N7458_011448 [Penicillium daleae]|uniref:Uncharacterized protein n=1 Tax=Penicillium daleae TaxID=63821 RepID=A0AAD6BS62_9EURO|nr:uncharacterized protein N7458_011448 [Penicillium daleae]KAJ5432292.1 hypothetical protein N7458_011448 [Penicillium daleae]
MSPVAALTAGGSRARGSETDDQKKATGSTSQISIECQGGNPLSIRLDVVGMFQLLLEGH